MILQAAAIAFAGLAISKKKMCPVLHQWKYAGTTRDGKIIARCSQSDCDAEKLL